MRIGGLATGMDIDGIVNDLMNAERIPLDKMEQDKTKIEWQRDAYREVNTLFSELDQQMLDMKLERTYNTKSTTSSSSAVSATATANASNGSYSIKVSSLATSAINVSQNAISGANKINPLAALAGQMRSDGEGETVIDDLPTTLKFTTFHNDPDGEVHTINLRSTDSLNDILTKITNQDNGVRAFYDVQSDKVVMERTGAGKYNPSEDGPEIRFGNIEGDDVDSRDFFNNVLGLNDANEQGGTDARFTYNGAIELTSKTNSTTLNGVTFNFVNETDGPVRINVNNDVDKAFDNIMKFVDTYNKIVEQANGKLSEDVYRDFPPLTEEQQRDMSEREIEQWEEKAKSGLLRNDNILNSSLAEMRRSWYDSVENSSSFKHLSQIGITTSPNYLDGGKLIVSEDQLRASLREDPVSVHKLFSNDVQGSGRGIINRLDDTIDKTTARINERAGKSTSLPHQYTLGRRLDGIEDRISAFQRRLEQTESRYWSQFTRMEQAIQRMNDQSNYMMQQFNQQ